LFASIPSGYKSILQSQPPALKVLELTNLSVPMTSSTEKLVTSKSCVAVTFPVTHLDDEVDSIAHGNGVAQNQNGLLQS
jgi:hypothetical protein